jgi:hypothetical protein
MICAIIYIFLDKILVFIGLVPLLVCHILDAVCSQSARLWLLGLPRLATFFGEIGVMVGMPRSLGHIGRLDRRWFRAHPERRHRCRWPDTVELDLCHSNRGEPLVMAIRHLGRGHIVYQPVIFQGPLPRDERSAAALFALAATSPEAIPVIEQMDLMRVRCGLRRQTQKHRPLHVAGGHNHSARARDEPHDHPAPAEIASAASRGKLVPHL